MFDDRKVSVLAYNLETVMAEKLETVLSRGVTNTRPRDYYDIHVLFALRGEDIRMKTLCLALEKTTDKRNSGWIFDAWPEIIAQLLESEQLRNLWGKYQRNYDYARGFSFDDVCGTVRKLMDGIVRQAV